MFFLKKLVSSCLLPFPFATGLIVAGLLFSWLSPKRQRLGRWLTSLGALILLLAGYGAIAKVTLNPLEGEHPPLSATEVLALSPPAQAVVVLGSGFLPDRALPANDRLGSTGLARLVEGVRLWRIRPQAKLILSDGLGQGKSMQETAAFLGVPAEKLILEGLSMDTVEEVHAIHAIVGDAPFLLVTSAAHMHRSLAICHAQGLRPIAAATDYVMRRGWLSVLDLIPSTGNIIRSDNAIHEWIGILWSHLRGTI
jgi:uncharacterized SAM-binding protein YcdF (DUF218 family)